MLHTDCSQGTIHQSGYSLSQHALMLILMLVEMTQYGSLSVLVWDMAGLDMH